MRFGHVLVVVNAASLLIGGASGGRAETESCNLSDVKVVAAYKLAPETSRCAWWKCGPNASWGGSRTRQLDRTQSRRLRERRSALPSRRSKRPSVPSLPTSNGKSRESIVAAQGPARRRWNRRP